MTWFLIVVLTVVVVLALLAVLVLAAYLAEDSGEASPCRSSTARLVPSGG
jgi:Tfp pilus assembly protein PilX